MEHTSIIYPKEMTSEVKKIHFWFWTIVILVFSGGLYLALSAGDDFMPGKIASVCMVILLALLLFFGWERSGPIIISSRKLKWPTASYKWSDIERVRLTKVHCDEDCIFPVLLIEVKNKVKGASVADYFSDPDVISPMNPKKTVKIHLSEFSDSDIDKIITLISYHAKVCSPMEGTMKK